MIELNCTYEESKKILELGYDFSSVCTKFELYEADGLEIEKRYTKKIVYGEKVSEETVRSRYTLIGDEPWFQGKDWVQDFIPIIPKAALEACLPDYDDYSWYINAGKPCFIYEGGCTDNCQTGIFYLDQIIMNRFDLVYEAFIWCHEKYPEQLKKKFEEVMK